jgi:hypothetical protein
MYSIILRILKFSFLRVPLLESFLRFCQGTVFMTCGSGYGSCSVTAFNLREFKHRRIFPFALRTVTIGWLHAERDFSMTPRLIIRSTSQCIVTTGEIWILWVDYSWFQLLFNSIVLSCSGSTIQLRKVQIYPRMKLWKFLEQNFES